MSTKDFPRRVVSVTITVRDHVTTYESTQRETAAREFPTETSPGVIAGWAGRTALAQLANAEATYPIKRPEPEVSSEERLEQLAKAPTDAAAEQVAGGSDGLPF